MVSVNFSDWHEALGGKDNIVSSDSTGSRLVVVLRDNTKINKEKLNTLGVSNYILSSNKITMIVKEKASEIAAKIK